MDTNGDPDAAEDLHLSALRILVPPIQLLSAAMWNMAKDGRISDYGKLEDFVLLVTETVPELLSVKLKTQLILGLRAKLVLEMCRTEQAQDLQLIQNHLDRFRIEMSLRDSQSCAAEMEASESNFLSLVHTLLRDPVEREHFFQEVFPVEYGPKYDTALRELMWEFLSRLMQFLPVPDLKQTACWLSAAPSVLDESTESIFDTRQLNTLLKHHRTLGDLNSNGTICPTPIGDHILSCLSHVPLSVDALNTTTSPGTQPEILNDSILYSEELDTESIVVTDYEEVELATSMHSTEGMEPRTDSQEAEDARFQLEQKDESLDTELEFGELCERGRHLHGDVELVSLDAGHISPSVEVVCEEFGVVCKGLESVDREAQIESEGATQRYGRSLLENIEVELSLEEKLREEHQNDKDTGERGVEGEDASVYLSQTTIDNVDSKYGSQNRTGPGIPRELDGSAAQVQHQDMSALPLTVATVMESGERKDVHLRSKAKAQQSKHQVRAVKNEADGMLDIPERQGTASVDTEQSAEGCGAVLVSPPYTGLKDGTVQGPPLVFTCLLCSSHHTEELGLRRHVVQQHPGKDSECLLTTEEDRSQPDTVPAPGKSFKQTQSTKTCPVCGKTFSRAADMRRHQRTHTGERPYKCPQCGKSFLHSFDLRRHQRNATGSRLFQCCVCGTGFDKEVDVKNHCSVSHSKQRTQTANNRENGLTQQANTEDDELRSSGEEGQHKCSKCKQRHQAIHSGSDPLSCSVCKVSFTQSTCLCQHYSKGHKDDRFFDCSQCLKGFSRLSNLIKHQRSHTGERPYQCSHCAKRFTQLPILARHERIHTGERPFLCSECGKRFLSSGELSKHLQCHSEERPFPCPKCDKTFKANRFLKKHLQTHSGERPFPCSFCGKKFAKTTDLTRHRRIHTGERPHLCAQCGKSFLTSAEVAKHQRYHTGERPFKCAQCGKTFTQSCYLTVHMRIHTGERPYGCTLCAKRFNSTTPLRRHMLTHTGEKPFVCSECGKAFNRLHLLRSHEQTHMKS